MTVLRRRWLMLICILAVTVLFWKKELASGRDNGVIRRPLSYFSLPSLTDGHNKDSPQSTSQTTIDRILSEVSKRRKPKVFIYTLPPKFNLDISQRAYQYREGCINLKNGGIGDLLYTEGELRVFGTNQFSLEVILHNQLLHSKYRTEHPEEADVFYIPAYVGTYFFCGAGSREGSQLQEEMFQFINTMPYFKQGKPHLSALAKIERELADLTYPILRHPLSLNVTYIVIERESKASNRRYFDIEKHRVIVAPYPSYGHFDNRLAVSQTINAASVESRPVFMLLAASDRRTNGFRNKILDQISTTVQDTRFSQYLNLNIKTEGPRQIWLNTKECLHGHENITVEWMQNSVFCLQPHGDSPTRKSFYDSIVSGCIPVIFTFPEEDVVYPFQRVLNYSDFIVSIEASRIEKNGELVLNILKDIPHSEIVRLHSNVVKVARMLQYSFIDEKEFERYYDTPYVDALDMIMDEVKYVFNL